MPLERELVFDRFSRGAGSNRRAGSEGVGLGLSLVAEHVVTFVLSGNQYAPQEVNAIAFTIPAQ